jgi:hypothetical protein
VGSLEVGRESGEVHAIQNGSGPVEHFLQAQWGELRRVSELME